MDPGTSHPSEHPLLVVDVETSGVNPFRNEILSLALVPFQRAIPPLEVFIHTDSAEWNPYAKGIFEKYASKWAARSLTPSKACDRIEEYLAEAFAGKKVTPLGHNIAFDLAFLKQLVFRGNRDEIAGLSHRALDTHTMLYILYRQGKVPGAALSSDGAFQHFGIRVPEAERHTALGDAIATRELACILFDILRVDYPATGHGVPAIHSR